MVDDDLLHKITTENLPLPGLQSKLDVVLRLALLVGVSTLGKVVRLRLNW